jgi:NAD(P)-dependent dehydrogenase (short-subunit alcohol dehydrogenase family)
MPKMTNKPVAFVTGARRGIGYAIASKLAAGGFDLYLADIGADDGAADRLRAHGARVAYLQGDIGDTAVHEAWVAAIREGSARVDCLVNNAGMGAVSRGDVMDLQPENFDRVMAVNLRGTAFLTLAVLRLMLAQLPGAIPRSVVNIGSISATHVSIDRLDYCVSKAALAMWSTGLAVRFAKEGIGVFEVRPGIVRSDMTAPVTAKYDRLIAEGLVPAGRWGEGEDVAKVVASLASGAFAYATGSVVDVGGGLSISRF